MQQTAVSDVWLWGGGTWTERVCYRARQRVLETRDGGFGVAMRGFCVAIELQSVLDGPRTEYYAVTTLQSPSPTLRFTPLETLAPLRASTLPLPLFSSNGFSLVPANSPERVACCFLDRSVSSI